MTPSCAQRRPSTSAWRYEESEGWRSCVIARDGSQSKKGQRLNCYKTFGQQELSTFFRVLQSIRKEAKVRLEAIQETGSTSRNNKLGPPVLLPMRDLTGTSLGGEGDRRSYAIGGRVMMHSLCSLSSRGGWSHVDGVRSLPSTFYSKQQYINPRPPKAEKVSGSISECDAQNPKDPAECPGPSCCLIRSHLE